MVAPSHLPDVALATMDSSRAFQGPDQRQFRVLPSRSDGGYSIVTDATNNKMEAS
jgi:hypothetical protein